MVRVLSRPPLWVKKLTPMWILCEIHPSLSIITPPAPHTSCFRLSPILYNVSHSLKTYLKIMFSVGIITTSNTKPINFFSIHRKEFFLETDFLLQNYSFVVEHTFKLFDTKFVGTLICNRYVCFIRWNKGIFTAYFSNLFSFKYKFKGKQLQEYKNLYYHVSKLLKLTVLIS